MITAKLKKRGTDKWGSGEFGASRGDRTHNGIDYACEPGTQICSPYAGKVTKLGYPYGDDLSFRYVEVTDYSQRQHRIFYVEPSVEVGKFIADGEVVGVSQKLGNRYPEITEHVHYEVIKDGEYLNPEDVYAGPVYKEADKG